MPTPHIPWSDKYITTHFLLTEDGYRIRTENGQNLLLEFIASVTSWINKYLDN